MMIHDREGGSVECDGGDNEQEEHHAGNFDSDVVEFGEHSDTRYSH
jgi:hypothetical protein